jgi:hypothetical protein
MSPQQPNIETDDEHSLSTEPEEQAHLQDVVPEAADAGNEGAESIEQQLDKAQETIKDCTGNHQGLLGPDDAPARRDRKQP